MAALGGNGSGADASGDAAVTVRQGGIADAAAVARLHASQIADGFLSSLGPRFLARLYRRICRQHNSFLLVAEESGRIVGFVAGAVGTRRLFAAFLVRDAIPALLASPWRIVSSAPRVLETLRHGQDGTGPEGDGELLAIAVDPGRRGSGIGRRLVDALLDEMDRRGVPTVEVVVGADNAVALSIYGASGFTEVRRFELHPGTSSIALHHRAPMSQPAPGPSPA